MNHQKNSLLIAATLMVFIGCSADHQLAETTLTNIGAQGGVALSADQLASLDFAENSIKTNTQITVTTQRGLSAPAAVSLVYDFGPDGLTFDEAVELSIQVPQGVSGPLAIAQMDGVTPLVLGDSRREGNVVSASLKHFSSYAVVNTTAPVDPCQNQICGDRCDSCTPGDPNCTAEYCDGNGACVSGNVTCGTPDAGPSDSGAQAYSDAFQQHVAPVIDVLLVIDDSGSMADERAALAQQAGDVVRTLQTLGADFRLGSTTTDPSFGGALVGATRIITSTTPVPVQALAGNIASIGISGAPQEQGLRTSRLATSGAFSRTDASLTVVYISDEDDADTAPVQATVDALRALKGVHGDHRVQLNAIVGQVNGCASSQPAPRYADAVALTSGASDDICAAPWANALTNLGGPGFGLLNAFELSQPADASTIVVSSAGSIVTGWTYDAATNSVVFAPGAVPVAGATVIVDYSAP